jgi:hypothetical protein
MDIKEVIALKNRRQEQHELDMEAIERVVRMLSESSESEAIKKAEIKLFQDDTPPPAAPRTTPVPTSKAVRESIKYMPELFTIAEVRDYLREIHPTVPLGAAIISPALKRIESDGLIATVETGKGSTPTKYRRVSA